jgi:cytochrome c oxidase subunit 2
MRHLLSILTICLLLLGVATPFAQAETRTDNLYWAPENITVGGEKIDQILNFIFWLTLFVFVATQTVYIIYLVKYRRRPGHKAHYSHGNNTLEFWWTIIPTAIFLTLAIWGNRVWSELTQSPVPENAVSVDIVSYQFGWDFRYAGADNKLGDCAANLFTTENKFGVNQNDPAGKDDFTATELVIPAGRPVHVLLRSRDVIHSFYVPSFRLYQDAVPGRTIKWVQFTAKRPAELELACSQLCGTGHYNMKAKIRILPEEEFNKWYAEKSAAAKAALAGL